MKTLLETFQRSVTGKVMFIGLLIAHAADSRSA